MKQSEFHQQVGELEACVLGAMALFFAGKGIHFDQASFRRQTSVDLDALSKEAFFFGADVFPQVQPDRRMAA